MCTGNEEEEELRSKSDASVYQNHLTGYVLFSHFKSQLIMTIRNRE